MGFNRDNLVVAWIYPTLAGYEGPKETALYWNMLDRLNAIPGVKSASMSRIQVLSGYWGCDLALGGIHNSDTSRLQASCNSLGPRFFETMGIPLLLGRDFSYTDKPGSPKVAVISESTARDYFPGANPLGQELGFHDETFKDRLLIIGVVKDIHTSLREEQSRHSPRGVYISRSRRLQKRCSGRLYLRFVRQVSQTM